MSKEDLNQDTQSSSPEITEMAFMHARATDKDYILSESEREIVATASNAFKHADAIIVRSGGKAGRLGECIIGTALLEALLLALRSIGKAGISLNIMVDEAARGLFAERDYREKYWDDITISHLPPDQDATEIIASQMEVNNILILDFHGKNDGMPCLQIAASQSVQPKRLSL